MRQVDDWRFKYAPDPEWHAINRGVYPHLIEDGGLVWWVLGPEETGERRLARLIPPEEAVADLRRTSAEVQKCQDALASAKDALAAAEVAKKAAYEADYAARRKAEVAEYRVVTYIREGALP